MYLTSLMTIGNPLIQDKKKSVCTHLGQAYIEHMYTVPCTSTYPHTEINTRPLYNVLPHQILHFPFGIWYSKLLPGGHRTIVETTRAKSPATTTVKRNVLYGNNSCYYSSELLNCRHFMWSQTNILTVYWFTLVATANFYGHLCCIVVWHIYILLFASFDDRNDDKQKYVYIMSFIDNQGVLSHLKGTFYCTVFIQRLQYFRWLVILMFLTDLHLCVDSAVDIP